MHFKEKPSNKMYKHKKHKSIIISSAICITKIKSNGKSYSKTLMQFKKQIVI